MNFDEGFAALLAAHCDQCGGYGDYIELAGAAPGEVRHGVALEHREGCPLSDDPVAVEYYAGRLGPDDPSD